MSFIGAGVVILGELQNHADINTYTVHLVEGQVYDFWLAGVDTPQDGGGLTPPPNFLTGLSADLGDPELSITGPASFSDTDSAEGTNAVVRFAAPFTGDYTVSVSEAAAFGGAGGHYVLNVTNMSFDVDLPGHTFLAGGLVGADAILAENDVLASAVDPSFDNDVVAVSLAGGEHYDFSLRGFPGGGTFGDPELYLLDPDGHVVAFDDDSGGGANGTDSLIDDFVAGSTGTFFLVAADQFGSSGTYELSYSHNTPVLDDFVPGDATTTFNLPLNGSIAGEIQAVEDPGNADWYAIRLVAGQAYQFDLVSTGLADPELFLRDDTGNVVASNDDSNSSSNSQILFTPSASGLYFVDAHDDSGLGTGKYKLSATLLSPITQDPVHTVATHEDALRETVDGSDRNDQLTASDFGAELRGERGSDTLLGGAGGDSLFLGAGGNHDDAGAHNIGDGGGGSDSIRGSSGADLLMGGIGNDFLFSEATGNTVLGGDGDDQMFVEAGAGSMQGGAGNDFLTPTSSFENDSMAGDGGNDTIFGGVGDDSILGGDDNDSLTGGFDNDTVFGGDGNDTISGGDGVNQLNGGNGNDTFDDIDGGDLVTAGTGVDHVRSLIGWTLDTDEENLTLLGGATINGNGNTGANVIFGNDGANVLSGLGGNDTVNGGFGNDTLIGGFGKDLNTGSGGLDHIKFNALGESGVTFATRDAINTFAHGDKIDLSAIDANTNAAGNQAFTFSASQTLTGLSGLLIAQQVATNSFLVLADVNGDANADFSLNVYTSPGFGAFQSWDFIP
jgi:hypothetical protein